MLILSNSDTQSVRALYRDFRVDVVHASRSINSRGAKRGKVREVVVRNFHDGALLPLAPR
jgi:DNA adenine methylase